MIFTTREASPIPSRQSNIRALTGGHETALLCLFTVLLFGVHNSVTVGALKGYGSLAQLLATVLLAYWFLSWLCARDGDPGFGRRPFVSAMLAAVGWVVFAFLAAYTRELGTIERSGTFRALAHYLAFIGAALFFSVLATRNGGRVALAKALVFGACFSALVGAGQFYADFDYARIVAHVPGLRIADTAELTSRFVVRAQGTSTHAIEFAVVSASLVPLAAHYWRFATGRGRAALWAGATGLLSFASLIAISRSGVVALTLAVGIYSLRFNWSERVTTVFLAGGFVGAMQVLAHGVLSTLRYFLLNTEDDASVAGRTDDYGAVSPLFWARPWLGYGLGTFRPELYRILDNQYLGMLLTGGIIGFVLLLTLILFVLGSAVSNVRFQARTARIEEADLTYAALSGFTAMAVSAAFFDLLSFKQATAVFLLLSVLCVVREVRNADDPTLPSARIRWARP